ncbi:MAG TPA: four helix bundle protein [bacterium]|nr:four helix bundle protein [bacterium]
MRSSKAEGTKGKRFEELIVYQRARGLVNEVYALTRRPAFAKDWGLADQIRRAAVSIMSNIAEGFERGSNVEFVQFLYIAKGSCGEVRAQLTVAMDQGYITEAECERLSDTCRIISGMLSSFINYLKGAKLQGPKFTPSSRNQAAEEVEKRIQALRAAQQANIRNRGHSDGT